MSAFGDRFDTGTNSRYIKHPPAGATSFWRNGQPLDAGSAMVIDQNISCLALKGTRNLFIDRGPGLLPDLSKNNAWSNSGAGFADTSPLAAGTVPTGLGAIPWDIRDARQYGPFVLIADRELSTPAGYTVRDVNVSVTVKRNLAAALHVYAALMLGGRAPSDAPEAAIAWLDLGIGGASGQYDLLLSAVSLITTQSAGTPIRCRRTVASNFGNSSAIAIQASLWIGYLSTGATDQAVYTISAHEVPRTA
jgi:hypothetical protein